MDSAIILSGLTQILNIISVAFDACERHNANNRRWWVRPANLTRNEEGFYTTCTQQLMDMDEEDFMKLTRISLANYNLLLNLLKEKMTRHSNRKPIQPKVRLSLTLLYVSQGCSIKVLAVSHKLGVSTVREIIYDTCQEIWEELGSIYMSPPNQAEWKKIAIEFYIKTGMPNCIGAIDGKHVKIICQKKSGSLYYNYKNTFSVVLLAACDSNNTFTFIDVGAFGSQSDGGIFMNSIFGRKILNNTIDIPEDSNLPNSSTRFPFYFVADSAFPLKKNIMRPYPGRHLSSGKKHFNEALSKARVRIEHTFGILSSRWRILNTTIHAAPKNVDKIILATTVLHNFLMLTKDCNYTSNIDDLIDENTAHPPSLANRSCSEAFMLRNFLKDYLETDM